MLLTELFESDIKHVTFCFGRFNPPTLGHAEVFKTMKEQGGDMMIFTTLSQDSKKNPLDYATKIDFIRKIHPQYAKDVIEDSNLNTIAKVAKYLNEQGYNHATFVGGDDRKVLFDQLVAYNGKTEGKKGPIADSYKFETLDFKSSGAREDGAEGIEGISGTLARQDAIDGDLEKFAEHTGAGKYAEKLYDAVRKGMGINEDLTPSEKITKWRKSKTDTDIRTFQGYQMKFADDGLKIYKDGELVFKRDGDFSNPTNKQVVVGKMAVSRLIDQKKRKNES